MVAVGRRILPKANLVDEAAQCLRLLSGRNHRVYTAVCLVTPKEAFRQRLIETRVRFKRLSEDDIQAYIGSGEWRGKAGGYAVQGIAGSFVVKMVGSYTNIVGLPLYNRSPCSAAKVFRSASAGSTPPTRRGMLTSPSLLTSPACGGGRTRPAAHLRCPSAGRGGPLPTKRFHLWQAPPPPTGPPPQARRGRSPPAA